MGRDVRLLPWKKKERKKETVCQDEILYPRILGIQGGKDAWDALSCTSLSAQEPRITGLSCRKRPVKIRHPVHYGHPVLTSVF